jgi:dTMP kinase
MELERIAVGNAQPDLTIFLDIPPEAGLLRVSKRRGGEPADRFEAEGMEFHSTLRNAFAEIAKAEPERCIVVNALAPEDVVAAAIWREVETRLLGEAPQKPRRTRRRQKAEERA